MRTLRVIERTGKDGVLHISIPLEIPDADYDVLLVVQPKERKSLPDSSEDLGWPKGYFESTFGSIDDDTFARPPQGDMPSPVEFD